MAVGDVCLLLRFSSVATSPETFDQSHCSHLQVTVLGTPAEEVGGGKKDLIKAKAFDDIDVAMMAHPFRYNVSRPNTLSRIE